MKRMIDGIFNCSVEEGRVSLNDDLTALITFKFPRGYWPISLNSKLFSILPGRIDFGDDTTSLNSIFLGGDGGQPWNDVTFSGGDINVENIKYNDIVFNFTFSDKATRDAFVESLFGKGATGESTKFATPISMLLVAYSASAQY